MIEGIDVSHYQDKPSLAGLGFLIAKATEGTNVRDPDYQRHIGRARAVGLVTGAYHFGRAGDGVAQARFFLDTVGPSAGIYVLDHESDMTDTQAKRFLATIAAAGHETWLYDSLRRRPGGYPDLGQKRRWIALWGSSPPPVPWDLWQYSNSGGALDRDRFDGTMAELKALFGAVPQHAVHIAHDAMVRYYTLNAAGTCITKPWKNERWTKPSASFPCGPVTLLPTCDGTSRAKVVHVRGGDLRGKVVRVYGGVTVTP